MTTLPAIFYGEGLYGEGYYVEGKSQNRETAIVNKSLTPLPPPVFTGMKLQEDVIFGDLVLNTIDENNVIWVCTDIEGWWDLPDPEFPELTRGWGDGSYDARGRWQSRQITLNGSFLTPDPSRVAAARNSLINAANLVYDGAWLKTKESPTRAAFVRLSGRPQIATVNARGRTDFSIGLKAADPLKYSWNDGDEEGYDIANIPCKNTSTGATGELVISNIGNAIVSVFMEVTGPITGDATIYNSATDDVFTIVDPLRGPETRTITNKSLTSGVATLTTSVAHTIQVNDLVTVSGVDSTFNGEYAVTDVTSNTFSYLKTAGNVSSTGASGSAVRAADVMEIDTYTREVALNGITSGARAMIDALVDWITLAPGENTIRFIDEGSAASTALLKMYYRSGWIG
jgi:hypothetical protein